MSYGASTNSGKRRVRLMLGLYSALFKHMLRRWQFSAAILVAVLFALASFSETCFRYYGSDLGEVPSPAYGWAWNMTAMQNNSARIYLFFFMLPLAALIFSGSARQDIVSGSSACLISRMPLRRYIVAHAVMSFVAGFALTLSFLCLLQALAFMAFPLSGVSEGYIDTPIYLDVIPTDGMLAGTKASLPYAYNAIFMVWTSTWAGASSLMSFGLSLLIKGNKAFALLSPTAFWLAVFQVSPLLPSSWSGCLYMNLSYPDIGSQTLSLPLFAAVPIAYLALALLFILIIVRVEGRDILL